MVTGVRRPGATPKLVSRHTGPWQIVTADKVHVYDVHYIVTGELKEVEVVRLQFYVDKYLEMTVTLRL